MADASDILGQLSLSGNSSFFPTYFRDVYCPSMEMTMEPDGTYVLSPNDHIDYYYFIKQDDLNTTIWYVCGCREEDMYEVSLRFVQMEDGRWESMNWYP